MPRIITPAGSLVWNCSHTIHDDTPRWQAAYIVPWDHLYWRALSNDYTSPTLLGITRADPNPTGTEQVHFLLTFSDPVSGADAADFSLILNGIAGAEVLDSFIISPTEYLISVSTGTGEGTLRLITSEHPIIYDGTGNLITGLPVIGESYTIERHRQVFLPLVVR